MFKNSAMSTKINRQGSDSGNEFSGKASPADHINDFVASSSLSPKEALEQARRLYACYRFRECATVANAAVENLVRAKKADDFKEPHQVVMAGLYFYAALSNDTLARNMATQAVGLLPAIDEALLLYRQAVSTLEEDKGESVRVHNVDGTEMKFCEETIAGSSTTGNPFVTVSELILPPTVPFWPPAPTPRRGDDNSAFTACCNGRSPSASPSSIYSADRGPAPGYRAPVSSPVDVARFRNRDTRGNELEEHEGSESPQPPPAPPSTPEEGTSPVCRCNPQETRDIQLLTFGQNATNGHNLLPPPILAGFFGDPEKKTEDRLTRDISAWKRSLLVHIRNAERFRTRILEQRESWANSNEVDDEKRGRGKERS